MLHGSGAWLSNYWISKNVSQNVYLSMICKIFSTNNFSSSCINCKITGNRVQYLSFYVNSASNEHSTNGHDGAMNIHAWYCATRDQNKMRAWTYIHIFKCIWTITASFPGPAQLSIACSMETWGEPGNETRTEQKPLRKLEEMLQTADSLIHGRSLFLETSSLAPRPSHRCP